MPCVGLKRRSYDTPLTPKWQIFMFPARFSSSTCSGVRCVGHRLIYDYKDVTYFLQSFLQIKTYRFSLITSPFFTYLPRNERAEVVQRVKQLQKMTNCVCVFVCVFGPKEESNMWTAVAALLGHTWCSFLTFLWRTQTSNTQIETDTITTHTSWSIIGAECMLNVCTTCRRYVENMYVHALCFYVKLQIVE